MKVKTALAVVALLGIVGGVFYSSFLNKPKAKASIPKLSATPIPSASPSPTPVPTKAK